MKIIKRTLHLLSLTQNDGNDKWNYRTLADLFSLEENVALDENIVKVAVKKSKKLFGFSLNVKKGARSIQGVKITSNFEKELISFYSNFIVSDYVKSKSVDLFQNKHKGKGLWVLASLYFASIKKQKVIIDYSAIGSKESRKFKVNPYHIVINKNSYYLVFSRDKYKTTSSYPLHRINDIELTDENFDEEPPSVEEIYKYSFGSFTNKVIYDFILELDSKIQPIFAETFLHLNSKFEKISDDKVRLSFQASDLKDVCREIFYFSDQVEIIKPIEAREYMIDNIKKILKKYK